MSTRSDEASYWRESWDEGTLLTAGFRTPMRLDIVEAVWKDRLALVRNLTDLDSWEHVPADIQDRLFEWSREPLQDVDWHADQMRERIHELEGMRS